ncbi:MAG: hypothetical protein STHCBS139747_007075 [Sporothrix thermara]
MSPRQTAFLSGQYESLATAANEMRHYEGTPFEADLTTMPFYGATSGEEARLLASAASMSSSRASDGSRILDVCGNDKRDKPVTRSSRATSPPDNNKEKKKKKQKHRPSALSLHDPDSPTIPHEMLVTTAAEASGWRPPHTSACSSVAMADTPPMLALDIKRSIVSNSSGSGSGSESSRSSSGSSTDSGDDGSGSSFFERSRDSGLDTCTDASDSGDDDNDGDERTPKPRISEGRT